MNEPVAPVVEPREGVAAPAPAEQAPAAPAQADQNQAASLPEELLRLPAIQGLLAGQPGAVSASLADFANRPEGKLIVANKDPLMKAGMGLYRSSGGDLGVIFNRLFVSDSQIQEADKAGQLTQLAPSFDEVSQTLAASGDRHPVLNHDTANHPTGLAAGGPVSPGTPPEITGGAPGAPMPAATSPKLIAGKARNIGAGSPTSGPKPGSGRLINQILKPVV